MTQVMKCTTVSVSIAAPPAAVYKYASNGENLPRWAQGLGRSVRRSGDGWVVETADGFVRLRFAAANDLGVLDHDVTLPTGLTVHNPMRVIANGSGSEVLFTVFQLPAMSDEQHAADVRLVDCDLRSLKRIVEGAAEAL